MLVIFFMFKQSCVYWVLCTPRNTPTISYPNYKAIWSQILISKLGHYKKNCHHRSKTSNYITRIIMEYTFIPALAHRPHLQHVSL
jgi:hypothetical protein